MWIRAAAPVVALFVVIACAKGADVRRWGVVTGDNVRVRSGPAEGYREMCELDKDEIVEIIEVSADKRWFRIVAPEKGNVWVHGQYVNIDGERGTLTGDRVRIRVRPDVNAERVHQLDKGAIVKVKGREGDWIKIAPPDGTDAWISTEYVKPITDEEIALLRQKKADKRQQGAEIAQLQHDAAMVAEVDRLLAAELDRPVEQRSLANLLRAYESVQQQVKDEALRNRVAVQLVLVRAMQDIQSALMQKAAPAPLPNIDFEHTRTEHSVGRAIDDLLAAHEQAKKLSTTPVANVISPPLEHDILLDGWVFYIGPVPESTEATHRIIRDGRLIALVHSEHLDLGSFVGFRVRLTGKPSGEANLPTGQRARVVKVARVEPVFE